MTASDVGTAQPPRHAATIDALAQRFGRRLSVAHAVREQHGRDISHHHPMLPDAVVYPGTTDEVAAIVGICAQNGTPIVPFGTGTSLEGHISAPCGGVCIDVSEMKAILRVNEGDLDAELRQRVVEEVVRSAVQGA